MPPPAAARPITDNPPAPLPGGPGMASCVIGVAAIPGIPGVR